MAQLYNFSFWLLIIQDLGQPKSKGTLCHPTRTRDCVMELMSPECEALPHAHLIRAVPRGKCNSALDEKGHPIQRDGDYFLSELSGSRRGHQHVKKVDTSPGRRTWQQRGKQTGSAEKLGPKTSSIDPSHR